MGIWVAGLVAGPVKWTERWIARAQRKADLRAERFRRHEEGMRAGTEPPSLLDRMESRITLFQERLTTSGMLQQEPRIGLRLAPATAACPHALAAGTNRPSINKNR